MTLMVIVLLPVTAVVLMTLWFAVQGHVLRLIAHVVQDQQRLTIGLEAAQEGLRTVSVAVESAASRVAQIEADVVALELRECRMS